MKNKLRCRIDLVAFAKSAFDKVDKGLYEFVLNRGDKKVNDLLHLVWGKWRRPRRSMSVGKISRVQTLRARVLVHRQY